MSKKCDNCAKKNESACAENEILTIPYVAHQSAAARQERQIRRMWIALIVSIALMFFTNMIWVGVFSSYDYSSEEYVYTQDGQGTNIIGDSNNVNGAETNNSQKEAD